MRDPSPASPVGRSGGGTAGRALAAAQSVPIRGDVEANVEEHVRLAGVAARARARIVVFPELSLTGYEIGLAPDLAFSEDDPRLGPLREAARSGSIVLVAGTPVRLGPRLHIGAFVLFPDGTVDLYTKRRLGAFSVGAARDGVVPPAEATVFSPGDRDPLVRLGGDTAAIAVCADTGSPAHPLAAAERGARTYLASMFVIPSEYDRETAALERYAARHSMVVAMANYGGPSGGLASAGRSAIWSGQGERLVRLEPAGAGVAVAVEHPGGWRAEAVA